MLSEDAIDTLVQPIIDRQESINTYVLEMIAKKLGDIGKLSPSDINRIKILMEMGTDIRKFNKELAKVTGIQEVKIKKLLKAVALDNYMDAKPLYDYRHKSFIPFEKNEKLQKIVNAISNLTAGTYRNISNSKAIGFMVKSGNKLVFKSVSKTYQQVIDEAIQAVKSGVDSRVVIRRAIKQLSDSGLRRAVWESGYTQRLDTAVRRNILDGVHAIQQQIEDEIGKQVGADGKELSVHENSAHDHEPFQGHIFTNEEYANLQSSKDFEDIDGEKFDGVARVIGMWNCRHFAYSIIIGAKPPRYTKKQLQRFIDRNNKGYTLSNGKHLTMYECTQMQRKLETQIRYAKEEQMAMKDSGDSDGVKLARAKVVNLTNQYKNFSKACGLPIKRDRIQISGYQAQ